MKRTSLEQAKVNMDSAYLRMSKAADKARAANSHHAAAELDYNEANHRYLDLKAASEAREKVSDGNLSEM